MKVIREISRKEFKKLQKESRQKVEVIAATRLGRYKEEKHKKFFKLEFEKKEYLAKQDMFGYTIRYMELEDGTWVEVKSIRLLPILCLLLWVLLLFKGCPGPLPEIEDIPIIGEDIKDYSPETKDPELIEIPGLAPSYTLTKNSKEIYLVNPDGNTVYFKYVIYEEDKEIYRTDYIMPNKMVRANLYDILSSGEHHLKIMIETIDMKTQETCNSAALETIIIK